MITSFSVSAGDNGIYIVQKIKIKNLEGCRIENGVVKKHKVIVLFPKI